MGEKSFQNKCEKDSIGHSGHIDKEGQFGFCFFLLCS